MRRASMQQGALTSLATPALLVFLHCLPPAGLLLFLHRWSGSAVDIGPLNARTLKGSLPAVAFHSLQVSRTAILPVPVDHLEGCLPLASSGK